MKFLLLLLILFIIMGWIRLQRSGQLLKTHRRADNSPPPPQLMHACPVCGTHIPEREAIVGQRGIYCSASHLRQAEG